MFGSSNDGRARKMVRAVACLTRAKVSNYYHSNLRSGIRARSSIWVTAEL